MYGRKLGLMWNFHAYHSVFSKLKNVLSEIHLLLTPGREHGKVFEKVPIIGFRRAKSLKDILVRATVAPLEKKKGCCRSCWGTRYEICKHVVITETFRSFSTQREYCIKPGNLSCCSSNIVFFFFFHAKHAQTNTHPMDTDSSIRHLFNVEIPRGKFVQISSILKRESTWKLWHRFDVEISTWIRLSKSTKYRWVLQVDFSMSFQLCSGNLF